MKNILRIVSVGLLSIFSMPVLAAPENFKELIENLIIDGILAPVVPLLISVAVVVFIYGVITLIFSEGGEKKEEGKKYMIWGIVGIFVMVSVWGLVNILIGTFNLSNTVPNIQIKLK